MPLHMQMLREIRILFPCVGNGPVLRSSRCYGDARIVIGIGATTIGCALERKSHLPLYFSLNFRRAVNTQDASSRDDNGAILYRCFIHLHGNMSDRWATCSHERSSISIHITRRLSRLNCVCVWKRGDYGPLQSRHTESQSLDRIIFMH